MAAPRSTPRTVAARPSRWHEPALHPLYLRLFATLLTGHGVDATALLARHALPWRNASDDDQLLPFTAVHDAIIDAIALTGRPWLGLEFGALAQPFSHGQVGFATAASDTLGDALNTLARFAELRTRAVRFVLHLDGRHAVLQLRESFDLGQARLFVLEACLVIVDRLLQALAGPAFTGAHYDLPWAPPAWAGAYSQYLSAPVQHGAATLAMRFPRALLNCACLGADAASFHLARRECERRLQHGQSDRDFASRVRRRLLASAATLPDADAMARQLNLSTRGLFRHLRAAGVSYQGMVDELRCEQACWHLRQTTDPIEAIAERLGFADGSNFSRTFKRWTGCTPSAYRQHAEDPASARAQSWPRRNC